MNPIDFDHWDALTGYCRGCGSRHGERCRAFCKIDQHRAECMTRNLTAANAWDAANPHERWRPTATRGKAWAGWLGGCQQLGYAHGSELRALLESFGEPSLSEDADDCLNWAVSAGLIVREETPTPTPQQFRFSKHYPAHPSWYGFRPTKHGTKPPRKT